MGAHKAKSVEKLLPWLYPKGVSTGDFTEAPRTSLIVAVVVPPSHAPARIDRLDQSLNAWSIRDRAIYPLDLSVGPRGGAAW